MLNSVIRQAVFKNDIKTLLTDKTVVGLAVRFMANTGVLKQYHTVDWSSAELPADSSGNAVTSDIPKEWIDGLKVVPVDA